MRLKQEREEKLCFLWGRNSLDFFFLILNILLYFQIKETCALINKTYTSWCLTVNRAIQMGKSTGKSDKALRTDQDDCEPFLFTLSRTVGLVTSTKEPDTINREKKAMKFKQIAFMSCIYPPSLSQICKIHCSYLIL